MSSGPPANRIRNEFPNAKIIVLSTYSGDVQVLQAIKAGARGYIVKSHARAGPALVFCFNAP